MDSIIIFVVIIWIVISVLYMFWSTVYFGHRYVYGTIIKYVYSNNIIENRLVTGILESNPLFSKYRFKIEPVIDFNSETSRHITYCDEYSLYTIVKNDCEIIQIGILIQHAKY